MVLSAAQPDHQRAVARGRGDRGGREERIADHRALRARAGARRARGARQRAERPQPRRPRAVEGRCKDCGVRGRYPGGAAACRGRAGTAGAAPRRGRDRDPVLGLPDAGRSVRSRRDFRAIRPQHRRVCCRGCSSWNCRVWCAASAAAGSYGLTERVRVKRDYGKNPRDRGIADQGADAGAVPRRSIYA